MAAKTVHPGGFIRRKDTDELDLEAIELAEVLAVSESTLNPVGVAGVGAAQGHSQKRGLWRSGSRGGATPETSPTGLSQALLDDLGRYRQQIAQAALLQQPAAAADVLHYTLCLQVLSDQRWWGRTLQDASFGVVASTTSRGDTGEGRAFDELAKARDGLSLQWLEIQGAGERFAAYRKLPQKAKDTLVAYYTARTLTIGVRGHCADQDALIAQLRVDFAGYWRPTRDNYLGRLTKGALFAQFGPLLGQQWLDWHARAPPRRPW